ncbi:hypothetical protein [Streptomyces bottropensis]|uniref:hypothetical protein n=1 Tax=Streptomyces bottropensis TaxID=42235 RepID=UPI0036829771
MTAPTVLYPKRGLRLWPVRRVLVLAFAAAVIAAAAVFFTGWKLLGVQGLEPEGRWAVMPLRYFEVDVPIHHTTNRQLKGVHVFTGEASSKSEALRIAHEVLLHQPTSRQPRRARNQPAGSLVARTGMSETRPSSPPTISLSSLSHMAQMRNTQGNGRDVLADETLGNGAGSADTGIDGSRHRVDCRCRAAG